MNFPLVSIIIPTHNRAHLIGETLDSIVAQTYTNWECIVVDDGSTDSTDELIGGYVERDSRFYYYKRPSNKIKGGNSCRNYGFELSKGKYVKWFDSDDLMSPNLLQIQLDSFANIIDVSVCKLEYYDIDNDEFIKTNNIFSNKLIDDYLVGNVSFYISGPLWKRSLLEKQVYLFDESITNLDDWDFNLRMLYQEPVIAFINEPLIQYRMHKASLSQEINKLNFNEVQSEFRAREKHLLLINQNKMSNPDVLKKFIKNRYKYFFREALILEHAKRLYFLRKLLLSEFYLNDIYGLLKTIMGFLVFFVFKKGYVLLK